MYNKKNHLILGLVALLAVFSSTISGQAAEPAKNSTAKTVAPIVFEGDELSFSEVTGDVYAQGKVKVTQNNAVVLADNIRGNTKKSEVWVDGQAHFLDQGISLTGLNTHYNYQEHTGTMLEIKGMIEKDRVGGENLEFLPDKYIIQNGTVTRCPAQVPDYHVSASKIEIWPGDKLIAHNAKFWIKDKVIFSLPKFEKSLVKEESTSAFPRLGYTSEDGVSIAQYLEYPINNRLSVYGDLAYYSKTGFRPIYGLTSNQKNYTVKLSQGYERNGDEEWIKKEPEVTLSSKAYRIGHSPFSARISASAGEWTEDTISGSRNDYGIYFNSDPIKLSDKFTVSLGTGYQTIRYGYDDSTNNIWRFNTTITAKPDDRLTMWTGYSIRNQSGTSVYEYDRIDSDRELNTGFMYKVDHMNSFGVKMNYYLDKDRVEDVDYTWRRNLHCWEADITYRAKREQITMKLSTIEW